MLRLWLAALASDSGTGLSVVLVALGLNTSVGKGSPHGVSAIAAVTVNPPRGDTDMFSRVGLGRWTEVGTRRERQSASNAGFLTAL